MRLRNGYAAIIGLVLFIVLIGQTAQGQETESIVCHEDEIAIPVSYRHPDGIEDQNGVTRLCVNYDEWFHDISSSAYADGYGEALKDFEAHHGPRVVYVEILVPIVLEPYVTPSHGPR